jgi:hypothetical protein
MGECVQTLNVEHCLLGCPGSVARSDRWGIQQDNGYPAQCRNVPESSVNVGSFHTLSCTSLSTTSAKRPSLNAEFEHLRDFADM